MENKIKRNKKGQFAKGTKTYYMLGKKHSKKTREKMSASGQLIHKNEKHALWKGDKVGYNALHAWVKRNLKKPEKCQHCKKEKSLDLANKSRKYKREITDWLWLCRSCHIKFDGAPASRAGKTTWKN